MLLGYTLLLLFSCYADSAKILVFSPKFGYSHMNFMGNIADKLHKAGHNVTVLQPVINPQHRGTGCKEANVLQVPADEKTIKAGEYILTPDFWSQIWSAPIYNPIPVLAPIPLLSKMFRAGCENMLAQTDIIEDLKKENFDLAITELFDFSGIPVIHAIGIKPIIGASSFVLQEGTALAIGAPVTPSFIPGSQSVAGDDGSFYQRILNAVFTFCSYKFQSDMAAETQKIMDERFPGAPNVWDIVNKMSFILTNSDPLMDFPKPTLHKVVDLGGISVTNAKPLDEKFSKLFELRNKTVYISFGSVALSSTMPQGMKDTIVNVLKRFPDVTFIWKYETPEDGTAEGVENVILTTWAPQNDILAEPRLSLFVTHGGAGSTFEAAARGVPLAIFPLFGDQMRNARIGERIGYGFACSKEDLVDETRFEAVIRRGLTDDSLRVAARRISSLMKKRPFSPEEVLLKTVDLAVAMGDRPLFQSEGAMLSYIAYYNLDLLAIVVTVSVAVLFVITHLLRIMFGLVCCQSTRKQKTL